MIKLKTLFVFSLLLLSLFIINSKDTLHNKTCLNHPSYTYCK